jgi:hypothetical protein
MSTTHKKLLIPSNLDFEQLLKDKPTEDYKGVKDDYLAFICHTLINLKSSHRKDILKDNSLVRMNARILQQNVYCYRACLDYLIFAGVITTDRRYIVGHESIGYDFSITYLGSGFKEYEIKKAQFNRTLSANAAKRRKEADGTLHDVRHLTRFFNEKYLDLDYKRASEWIEESRQLHLAALPEKCPTTDNEALYAAKINDRHDLYKIGIGSLKAGVFNCSVDPTGKRFHSALTNLKSEMRNFITYGGKELVSVDIKNSQPYFSLALFKKSFYSCSRGKNALTLKNIYPELYTYLRKSSAWQILKTFADGSDGLVNKYIPIESYKKAVLQGSFYEDFAKFIYLDTGGYINLSRTMAKEESFRILFGIPSFQRSRKSVAFKSFTRHYSNVAQVFDLLKSRPVNDSNETHYQDFAILLQRIESDAVLNLITRRFHETFQDAPIFTIHDCIATDVEHEEVLTEIINSELVNFLGTKPTLKPEYWKPDNAELNLSDDIFI